MNSKNDYYASTLDGFFEGKDSVMEMAKILSYDKNRMVANVFSVTSRQYREDVPVLFPSLYQNTGIISPPVVNSTSLLFWGPDREPFLFPAQLTIPNVTVENGVTKVSASPGFTNALLTLKNVQGGEQLIRSLGGAYLFAKNMGDLELGTSRLNRLALTKEDGALEVSNERIRCEVGNSNVYLGPASTSSNVDTRGHFKFEFGEEFNLFDQFKGLEIEELIEKINNDEIESIPMEDTEKIFKYQFGHVFDVSGNIETDTVDGTELFSKQTLEKEGNLYNETLSKGGRKTVTINSTIGERVELNYSPQEVSFTKGDAHLTIDSEVITIVKGDAEITVNSTDVELSKGNSSVTINSSGQMLCSNSGKTYDLWPMLQWFYEERV